MTAWNPENKYSLVKFIRFIFRQGMKDIHSIAPGHIESYDINKNRANVVLANDKTTIDGERIQNVVITNVPVITPCFSGWLIRGELAVDQPVLVLFSERGITQFKQSFGKNNLPDKESFFDERDAIIIPGFGDIDNNIVEANGISIQDRAGENYITVSESGINMKSAGDIHLESGGEILLSGTSVKHDGINIGDDHKHTYARPLQNSTRPTDIPIPMSETGNPQ